jgi:hypothetical protein
MYSARNIIGCHLAPETRDQSPFDDVASTIHRSLPSRRCGTPYHLPLGPSTNHPAPFESMNECSNTMGGIITPHRQRGGEVRLVDITHHVMECHLSQETRVTNAFHDVVGNQV